MLRGEKFERNNKEKSRERYDEFPSSFSIPIDHSIDS